MFELGHSSQVAATPARVWALLADYGGLANWFGAARHSSLITETPVGVGSERRVLLDGMTLIERIVAWEPRERLAYELEGLPPLVAGARNEWRLTPGADSGTQVSLRMQVVMGAGPVGALLYRVALRRVFAGQAEALVDDLKRAVEAD